MTGKGYLELLAEWRIRREAKFETSALPEHLNFQHFARIRVTKPVAVDDQVFVTERGVIAHDGDHLLDAEPFRVGAQLGCTSDLDCSVGQECAINAGIRGICITPIHDRSLGGNAAASLSATTVGRGDCTADSDCTGGTRCRRKAVGMIGRCGR